VVVPSAVDSSVNRLICEVWVEQELVEALHPSDILMVDNISN
jgi:hypothetical protein